MFGQGQPPDRVIHYFGAPMPGPQVVVADYNRLSLRDFGICGVLWGASKDIGFDKLEAMARGDRRD